MESMALYTPSATADFCRRSFPHLRHRLSATNLRPISSLKSHATTLSTTHKFNLFNPIKFSIQNHQKFIPRSSSSAENTAVAIDSKSQNPPPQGAKIIPLILSLSIGLIVRFVVPKPPEVSPQAWQLLSIFLSTIAGLVFSPLPVGAWAFLGLTTSIITKTLTFSTAFTNEVIWLIVISFFYIGVREVASELCWCGDAGIFGVLVSGWVEKIIGFFI